MADGSKDELLRPRAVRSGQAPQLRFEQFIQSLAVFQPTRHGLRGGRPTGFGFMRHGGHD
jgi:hypothetical protein